MNEAFEELFRATWSVPGGRPLPSVWRDRSGPRRRSPSALELVDRSLQANALDIRALNLRAALLRHLGKEREALAQIGGDGADRRPLDARLLAERWLTSREASDAKP